MPAGLQGYDRYAYANNSPVNYTDPTGHFGKHNDDKSDYWNKRNKEKVKNLEKQWKDEKDAKGLAQLVKATSNEMSLDPGASLASLFPGFVGGKPMFGMLGEGEPPPPNYGKYIAGGLMMIGGVATMTIGGIAVAFGLGEIAAAQVAAPATFGLSELLAVVHAPAYVAVGGLIFAAGAGLTYLGGKVAWESGVLQNFYGPIISDLGLVD